MSSSNGNPQISPEKASPDTLELYGYLPEFIQNNDATNGYPFLSWLEGICSQLQIIDDLCRDSSSGPGWSSLMNVALCPNNALDWLAQFVGVNIPGNTQGTTPAADAAMRQSILSPQGLSRGSLAGLTAGAQAALGPGSVVQIIERYPDPYSIIIRYTDNDGNLTYGELAIQYPYYEPAGGTPNVAAAFPNYDDFPAPTVDDINAQIQALVPGGLVANIEDVG